MGIDVSTEIVIGKPPAEVARYAADPSNAPDWYENIETIVWRSAPPLRVGSRMDFVAHFLGRRIAYTYEVTDLVPARRLVMRTADGPFPMETTYTWEAVGEGATRMTLRNRGEPSGFARVGAPLMAAAVRRETAKNLRCLKTLLEGRAAGALGGRTAD